MIREAEKKNKFFREAKNILMAAKFLRKFLQFFWRSQKIFSRSEKIFTADMRVLGALNLGRRRDLATLSIPVKALVPWRDHNPRQGPCAMEGP